jgi:hypothetical protein
MPLPSKFIEHRVGIAIMAKAPIPGLAKTRLIPRLGPDRAALLQRWLLQRTVATAVIADTGPVRLWCAPDAGHPDFSTCRSYGAVSLHQQPEGDLGVRMLSALQHEPTYNGTLVIGTDCPVLSPAVLRAAALSLTTHDAVVVPAEDGGYVLIGMRHPHLEIFRDITWSTASVMPETRRRFASLGWSVDELPALWDIDLPEDFDRLCALHPDAHTYVETQEVGT